MFRNWFRGGLRSRPVSAGVGLFMAGPAILLALLAQTLSLSDKAQDIFTYVAIGIVFWAGLLGTLGALVGGRSHGRVVVVRRRRWG